MNNLRRALMFASVALTPFAANQVAKAQADAPSQVQLAQTPPMGWNSWNKFACNVSEQLIRETADAMVSTGMQSAGYQYVNIDDCWQVSRDAQGNIVADATRFSLRHQRSCRLRTPQGIETGRLYRCRHPHQSKAS